MTNSKPFEWTENLVREIVGIAHKDGYHSIQKTDLDNMVEQFKQSKSPSTNLSDGKDWEIVSFYFVQKVTGGYTFDFIMPHIKDAKYKVVFDLVPLEVMLKNKDFKIHSVKRMSDGEIFSIGDKISWGCTGIYETTLTGFLIKEGRLKFSDEKSDIKCDFLNAIDLHKLPTNPIPEDTVVGDKDNPDEYVTLERIKQLEKSGVYWMNKYYTLLNNTPVQPQEQADNSKPFVRQSKPMEEKDVVCPKQSPPLTDDKDKQEYEQSLHESKLWVVADLISRIYYYGNFKIETPNERTLAGLLNELGLFPTTEDKILMRPTFDNYTEKFMNFQLPTNANVTTDKITTDKAFVSEIPLITVDDFNNSGLHKYEPKVSTDNSDVQILTLKDLKCILMDHSDGTYRGIENWTFPDNTMPENLYQSALQLVNQKLKQ